MTNRMTTKNEDSHVGFVVGLSVGRMLGGCGIVLDWLLPAL